MGIPMSDDLQALGRYDSNGKLFGVVAFNGFNGLVCSMHCAGKGHWLSRKFLHQIFHYPFVQLKLEHVLASVAANNEKALRLDRKVGFTDVMRIPNGWSRGVDTILLKMSRNECRWVEPILMRRAA